MSQTRHVPALLAFVAGFCDAATFVHGDKTFSAHITGNLVTFAADLARGADATEWLKLVTFPVFAITVVCAAWVHQRLAALSAPHRATSRLLLAEIALLGVATGLAVFNVAPDEGMLGLRWVVIGAVVIAMAIQNSLHRLDDATGPFTTAMTGNVTSWLVEVTRAGSTKRRALGLVLAAFTVGCLAGAFGAFHFHFAALIVPTFVLAVAHFLFTREA